jgi:hypothetical protein
MTEAFIVCWLWEAESKGPRFASSKKMEGSIPWRFLFIKDTLNSIMFKPRGVH